MTTVDSPKQDALHWEPVATIQKFDTPESYQAWLDGNGEADRTEVFEGNVLLNAGITRLGSLLVGAGGTAYNGANTRLGVGDSNTAAVASQTDLQAVTNKQWVLCDSVGFSGQTLTVVGTFTTGLANFAWAEWGIDNGTANGTTVTAPMLNRKVAAMGTKASGATWVLTVTIVIS